MLQKVWVDGVYNGNIIDDFEIETGANISFCSIIRLSTKTGQGTRQRGGVRDQMRMALHTMALKQQLANA